MTHFQVTHSPRRLSEALALVRPFTWDVWIVLCITVFVSGPALFLIVIMPIRIRNRILRKVFAKPKTFHHIVYMREINRNTRIKFNLKRKRLRHLNDEEPSNMLSQCIWFTVNVYLKQCEFFMWDYGFLNHEQFSVGSCFELENFYLVKNENF